MYLAEKKRNDYVGMVQRALSEERFTHTLGVEQAAIALAERYGVNVGDTQTAALFHDFCKGMGDEEMKNRAHEYGLQIDRFMRAHPNLLHGPVASQIMRFELNINIPDVIEAIYYHTIGHTGMSRLEKVIYVADLIEEGRDYDGVQVLREAAQRDLDEAMQLALAQSMRFVLMRGRPLHDESVAAYNELALRRKI